MHLTRFILTIVLALPSSIYAATGPRLQIGYVSFVPGVAPLWVASDRRLFAQEGVDPELVFIGSAPTMLASMMAREVSLALTAGTAVMSAIAAGAPHLLLDNLSVEEAAEQIRWIRGRAKVELSGGVTLENVHDYAETGADFVSSGAITHSAPAVDISFRLELA